MRVGVVVPLSSAFSNSKKDRFVVANDHDRRVMGVFGRELVCRQDYGIFQIHEAPRCKLSPPPDDIIETVVRVSNLVSRPSHGDGEMGMRGNIKECYCKPTFHGDGELGTRGNIKEVYCKPNSDIWNQSMANISKYQNMHNILGADRAAAIAYEAKREATQYQHDVNEMRIMGAKV
jgi:hypothetical protein